MCLQPRETKRIITLTCRTFYCFRDIFTSQKSSLFLLCLLMLEKKIQIISPSRPNEHPRQPQRERDRRRRNSFFPLRCPIHSPLPFLIFHRHQKPTSADIWHGQSGYVCAQLCFGNEEGSPPLGSDRPGGQPAIQDGRERRAFDDSP